MPQRSHAEFQRDDIRLVSDSCDCCGDEHPNVANLPTNQEVERMYVCEECLKAALEVVCPT